MPDLYKRPKFSAADLATVNKIMRAGAAKAEKFLKNLPPDQLPTKVDYTPYVTFQHYQVSGGGCFNYAVIQLMDILKEMEYLYTPDVSYRALEYHYNQEYLKNGPDKDPVGDVSQNTALKDIGICPEAICHSDFDNEVILPEGTPDKIDGSTDIEGGNDLHLVPHPSPDDDAAAHYYLRIQQGKKYQCDFNTLKNLLAQYGPLRTGMTYNDVGHFVVCVGYDDNTSTFTFFNDYDTKFFTRTYNDVKKNLSGYGELDTFFNIPSDRSGVRAFSARVKINAAQRNQITASVSCNNLAPVCFWNCPNHTYMIDPAQELFIDIPLPDYVMLCWPTIKHSRFDNTPQTYRWCLNVKEHGVGAGSIDEFTLARLTEDPNCKSMDHIKIEKYSAKVPVTFPKNGNVNVYIDLKYTPVLAMPAYALSLTAVPKKGVTAHVILGKSPAPGVEVKLYLVRTPLCVNMPDEYVDMYTGKTDGKGLVAFALHSPGRYAVAIGNPGSAVASSNIVKFSA
ncbi:MAG: hypothetical protein ACYDG5_02710 [Dehalococcoidales bacterium]